MARNSPYEVDVRVLKLTDEALLVSDGTNEGWIPMSQIMEGSEITGDSCRYDTGTLVIPEWLAESRGLS